MLIRSFNRLMTLAGNVSNDSCVEFYIAYIILLQDESLSFCRSTINTVPLDARICVLRPLQRVQTKHVIARACISLNHFERIPCISLL